MAEEQSNTKNEDDLDRLLLKSEPVFFGAIKETYYLAVLSSLCIAISAFTQTNFQQATPYALTGASFFLIAFVLSLISKFLKFKFPMVLFFVYASTALGTLMLFLVIIEFGRSILMISRIPFFLIVIFGVIALFTSAFRLSKFTIKSRTKKIVYLSYIGLISSIVGICVGPIFSLFYLVGIFEGFFVDIISLIFSILIVLALSSSLVSAFLLIRERKLQQRIQLKLKSSTAKT
jgi:hypothetical protein